LPDPKEIRNEKGPPLGHVQSEGGSVSLTCPSDEREPLVFEENRRAGDLSSRTGDEKYGDKEIGQGKSLRSNEGGNGESTGGKLFGGNIQTGALIERRNNTKNNPKQTPPAWGTSKLKRKGPHLK